MTDIVPSHDATSSNSVVVSMDAMGGDKGPDAIIDGIAKFSKQQPDAKFIIHGNEAELTRLVANKPFLINKCKIRHADKVISMDEKPSRAMRNGKDSSMWNCLDAVKKGDASVAVSCGNTGALMAIAMVCLRKNQNVNRPAIAILWPSRNKTGSNIMLDVGADIRADAHDLLQYAIMGASYARNGFDIKRPRVGLLNVGTEEHKGRAELHLANDLISKHADQGEFDYIGFVEGNDIPSDIVDVIVTDGFTGNVALKTAEGTASFISEMLRAEFKHNMLSRIGAFFSMSALRRFSKTVDPRNSNGGVFLGLNGTVVKSHGAADATGISAAIALAYQLAKHQFSDKLAARVASSADTNE